MKRFLLTALLYTGAQYLLSAQTTVATESFEGSTSLFTATGGTFYSGVLIGGSPSNAQQFWDGSQSVGVNNGTLTLTSTANAINTQGYINISLHFRLASLSTSAGNGADLSDSVIVELSMNGGSTFTKYLSMSGTTTGTNSRWGFDATGTASATYPTYTHTSLGTNLQLAGPATVSLLDLPANADLRVRIRAINNAAGERWLIDSFRLIGTASSLPPCAAPSVAPTALTFPSNTTTSINGAFTATSGGADGYVVFAAPSSTTTQPSVANGTAYTSGNAPAGYTFVSSGSGTTFTAGGLTQNTTYNFFVFAYNDQNCTGGPTYNTTALTGSAATQAVPACAAPASASNITITPSFNSASGTFSSPTPAADSFVIFYAAGTPSAPTLTTGTTYTAANTPPGYGLVGKQESANTSFSIPGLAASTQYTVYVFSYNTIGCTGGPAYAAAASSTFTTTPVTIATYTWNVPSGNWTSPSSWTPARTSPASNDVLVFDGTVQAAPVVTMDFATPENISQLKFQNGAAALFQTGVSRTLNIGDGAAGEDFLLPVGNKLTVQSTASGASLTLAVVTGNTGLIADSVKLAGNAITSQAHRILSDDVSGIDVTSTGVVVQGTNFSGTVFGTTGTANTVEFLSGATMVVRSGTNVFGLSAPNSKVLYGPTSNVVFANGISLSPVGSGRTYPNLYVVNATQVNMSGGSNFTVNNLFVEAGSSFDFNGTSTNVITVNSDIIADGLVDLDAGTQVVFSNPNPVIGGTQGVIIRDAVEVAALTASSDSLVFSNGLTVTGTLTLNSGRVITGTSVLTLGTSSAAPGTLVYSGGVIEGTFKRYFSAAANTGNTGLFPMGRPGSGERRTATVEFTTAPTAGGSLTAFVDSASVNTINASVVTDGTCPGPFNVTTVAGQYLTVTAGDGLTGGVYNMTLQYQNANGVTNLCELAVAKRVDENGTWTIEGTQDFGAGTTAEPIVRHTGLTGFSDFVIAGSSANPLPLDLTRFDAIAAGRNAQLTWTLANSAEVKGIAVERSNDGHKYNVIGDGRMNGGEGTFTDAAPVAGRNYYRLRITDVSGAESVSAVRIVTFNQGAGAGVAVYPNPATDVIRIDGSGVISATLFDAAGRAVRTVTGDAAPATISLEGIAGGFYLLHATDGSTTVRERIQVIR